MNGTTTSVLAGLLVLVAAVSAANMAIAADQVTIVGVVSDNYEIITESGDIFVIAETEAGDELGQNVGKKVEVQGTIQEEDGGKLIVVVAYRILEEI